MEYQEIQDLLDFVDEYRKDSIMLDLWCTHLENFMNNFDKIKRENQSESGEERIERTLESIVHEIHMSYMRL